MVELQKSRVMLDDADVELQYLQDELINYKERKIREVEEERQRQLAQMADSVIDEYGTEDQSATTRDRIGSSRGA